jgi:hypothetical protein
MKIHWTNFGLHKKMNLSQYQNEVQDISLDKGGVYSNCGKKQRKTLMTVYNKRSRKRQTNDPLLDIFKAAMAMAIR